MADNTFKRIKRFNRFLVTKLKRQGGKRFFTAPVKEEIGPVLMESSTKGIKKDTSSWLFYKGNYSLDTTMSFIINTSYNPDDPSDKTIIIPFTLYTPQYSFTIDWGDGNTLTIPAGTALTTSILSHTYASQGQYSIRITSATKKMPVLNWSTSGNVNGNKYKIVQHNTPLLHFDPSCPNSSSVAYFADGCENLDTISNGFFMYNSQVRNYDYAFNGCIRLTHVPNDIFTYPAYQSSYQCVLAHNGSLIEVSDYLFSKAKAVDLSGAFYGDTNLENHIEMDKFFGEDAYINVDVHEIFRNCVKTTGDAIEFINKFAGYVAYVNGTGTFDTGYGTLTGKIYSQEIYGQDGELVRDLIPAKTGNFYNGKIAPQDCLYDSVEDEFLLPSSPFTYGTELDTDGDLENNLPASFKRNALYNCENWKHFVLPDSIWTGFPPSRALWLATTGEKNDWLLVDDENALYLEDANYNFIANSSGDTLAASTEDILSWLTGDIASEHIYGVIKPEPHATVVELSNIINMLPTNTSGETRTLDLSACVNRYELSAEDLQMVTDKGYTLVL